MIHHQKYYNHIYSLGKGLHGGEYIEFSKVKPVKLKKYPELIQEDTKHLHEEPYCLILDYFTKANPKLQDQYSDGYLTKRDLRKLISLLSQHKIKLEACSSEKDYEKICRKLYTKHFFNYIKDDISGWELLVPGLIKVTQGFIDFFEEAIAENKYVFVMGY